LQLFFGGWTERAGDENDTAGDEKGTQPGREGCHSLGKGISYDRQR
jgi:hypothetical protein